MTPADLLAIMPNAGRHADTFCDPLNEAMVEFGINTPERQAAFLAQIAHESGQLLYTREIWGPTPAQTHYEGRTDLGNKQAGDGKRFMGRGLIQITGRANYLLCGSSLNLNLIDTPEFLEQPVPACRSAAWFWSAHDLNELADAGDFERITRRINGGLNGQADRLAFWERAQQVIT